MLRTAILMLTLMSTALPALAESSPCNAGVVFADENGNGRRDSGERGLAGIQVSDGIRIVRSDGEGRYRLPVEDGRTTFVIKPPGYGLGKRSDGLPDFWRNMQSVPGPRLKYGGIAAGTPACRDFALIPREQTGGELDVLLFADPQPKSMIDVGYYTRDIVEPLLGKRHAALGLTLGDIVNDDLSLYPAMNAITARLDTPWLHVAGNHDIDFDATSDGGSLRSFRNTYGPDTVAWEETQAAFIGLDDVVYRPGQRPAYVGGLRADQFAFLEAYLPGVPKEKLLVIAVHIPFFNNSPVPERQSFRPADRERLFALLKDFPHVLLLSAHNHTQRHVFHGADSGWHGARPLHEYNVGAACGAFWSGVKDTDGIPDTTMADGTPNGYGTLRVKNNGDYALAWHPARDPADSAIGLHAPKALRKGAWPAWGVYANVYMGQDDSKVEYRVDDGEWKPMDRTMQPDPRLLAENVKDDAAGKLRGYDRSPEAEPLPHLWRGALPTDLAIGEHRVQVRYLDPWVGLRRAETQYRLESAQP